MAEKLDPQTIVAIALAEDPKLRSRLRVGEGDDVSTGFFQLNIANLSDTVEKNPEAFTPPFAEAWELADTRQEKIKLIRRFPLEADRAALLFMAERAEKPFPTGWKNVPGVVIRGMIWNSPTKTMQTVRKAFGNLQGYKEAVRQNELKASKRLFEAAQDLSKTQDKGGVFANRARRVEPLLQEILQPLSFRELPEELKPSVIGAAQARPQAFSSGIVDLLRQEGAPDIFQKEQPVRDPIDDFLATLRQAISTGTRKTAQTFDEAFKATPQKQREKVPALPREKFSEAPSPVMDSRRLQQLLQSLFGGKGEQPSPRSRSTN